MWRLLRQIRDEQGYLLIEVLLASIILSVGILAMLRAFEHSLEVARFSRNHAAAVSLLERKLIQLESGWDGIGAAVPEDSLGTAEGFRIELEPGASEGPLAEFRVTVQWVEGHRRPSISLTTVVLGSPEGGIGW